MARRRTARLTRAVKANPDLPASFVRGTLEGIRESRAGKSTPYRWGVIR